MNTSWIGRRVAEHGQAARHVAAFAFAALAIVAALPAHAFEKTSFADGCFEYFFAAPSPIPDPTTAALLLVGLAGLAGTFACRAAAGR